MPCPASRTANKSCSFYSTLAVLVLLPRLAVGYQSVVVDEDPGYRRIELPSTLIGAESLAFDTSGEGPYTGVSDGRVLKWKGDTWVEFAVPPQRRGIGKEGCDGTGRSMEDKCGRPLGLQFHRATGDLYIADAYFGLMVVGAGGGVATRLASGANKVPFALTNGVDVEQETGVVYFTDSSSIFRRRDWILSVLTLDSTGRFMRYDPRTKEVEVLMWNLMFPNGVALSKDGSFVLVGESTRRRVLRYWLRGARAGTREVYANVDGYPDNIKRNARGEFWVALNSGRARILKVEEEKWTEGDAVAVRLGEGGDVLEELRYRNTRNPVSEVEENNGTLWFGSAVTSFVGALKP